MRAERNVTQVDTLVVTRRRCAAVRRIGDYELLREIGSGGMATVWEARRPLVGGGSKFVALKLMSRELSARAEYRKMFRREAQLSTKLSFRNVVQVFDVGEEGGQYYLVMEWVDGMNLAQLVSNMRGRGKSLDFVLTAYIIGEILRGLAYAQTITDAGAPMGLVHRDVSPQNVLISVSGEVKVTDFGVARLAADETSRDNRPGKLRYMAPEQFEGQSRDPTVDLYAVGAILHELIDGRRFRDAADDVHLVGLVVKGIVPELQNAREVPPELDTLRLRLLEADPRRRIQSAEEALRLLMMWPGYRDASLELAKLCQAYAGVTAPRSGVHEAVAAPTPTGDRTQTAATRDASASGPVAASSVTAVDLPARVESTAPATSYPVGVVIALTGALVAGVGMGGFALWRSGADAEPVAAALENEGPQEPAVTEAPEPEPAPSVAEPKPRAEPADEEPEPEPASEPEPEPPVEAQPEAEPAPVVVTPKPAAPEPAATKPRGRAEVTFKTGDFTFVWVKVKGKVLALEPLKKVELPSGRHRVFFRQRESDDWQSAGRITVEPNKAYEVRMEKPGRVRLQTL